MKNDIFSYTLAAKVERILSIGSCDGYIDVYFKSYIFSKLLQKPPLLNLTTNHKIVLLLHLIIKVFELL